MGLRLVGDVELPAHLGEGGFDHAAIHHRRNRLYVAHTANDAVDVIDTRADRYVRSITGLKGVAGALVDEGQDLVFTSNRGENTVGIFSPQSEDTVKKVPAGLVTIPMPGRTRWAIFDPERRLFFVNIADPPVIVVVGPESDGNIERRIDVPARGPHGLEIDPSGHRLLCACDEGKLVSIDSGSGEIRGVLDLSGSPDVVFLSQSLAHLYVAIGDPGLIDVIDIGAWKTIEVVSTGRGAHTIAHDHDSNRVYAFLPETHRATVFQDGD